MYYRGIFPYPKGMCGKTSPFFTTFGKDLTNIFIAMSDIKAKPKNTSQDSKNTKSTKSTAPKVTLVLGSGGIRGISQIGILEVLHEAGIPIDHIVGCSIGALTGSLYADKLDLEQVYEIALNVVPTGYCYRTFGIPSLRKGLRGKGFFNMERLKKILDKNLTSKTFEELKVPFSVVATNVHEGELKLFSKGPLLAPLCASAAIPGIFEPIVIDDAHYVDGAVVSALPVQLVKDSGADITIAVNVRTSSSPDNTDISLGRSYNIMRQKAERNEEEMADIVLRPHSEGLNVLFANKNQIRTLYEEGKRVAEEKLPEIKALLRRRGAGA